LSEPLPAFGRPVLALRPVELVRRGPGQLRDARRLGRRRYSHIACHAAALSWLLGRKLRLDPAREEFVGDDEANRLRSLPSRKVL
jgi:hypothetical protein